MDKKILKKAYDLYHNRGMNKRKVRQTITKYYNVLFKEEWIEPYFGKKKSKPGVYSQREREFILYMYNNCRRIEKLIQYLNERHNFNITEQSIANLASKYGVKKKQHFQYGQMKVTYSDELKIISLYEDGKTSYEIANMYGYKRQKSITDILKKHGIKPRNTSQMNKYNKTYKDFRFDPINSPEKAYFLGLMLTDGYVSDFEGKNLMGIDLVDEDCISFLAKSFNSSYWKVKTKKSIRHKEKYRLVFHGKEHIQSIEKYGLTPRKSLTLQGPILSKEEQKRIPEILRGIIDGDGWIRKDGKEFFVVSASHDFIQWVKKHFEKIDMKELSITTKVQIGYNDVYLVRSALQHNIQVLKKKIYVEPMGMQRKYNRLHQIQERPSETIIGESQ